METISKQALDEYVDKKGTIFIVGNESVKNEAIISGIGKLGFKNVRTIDGVDSCDTSMITANETNIKEGTPIILSFGSDQIVPTEISGMAANKGYPILITTKDALEDSGGKLATFIKSTNPSIVYTLGSKTDLPTDSLNSLKSIMSKNSTVINLSEDTNIATLQKVQTEFSINPKHIYVGSSNTLNALAVSNDASNNGDPILLIDKSETTLDEQTNDYLSNLGNGLDTKDNKSNITIVGNKSEISDDICGQIYRSVYGEPLQATRPITGIITGVDGGTYDIPNKNITVFTPDNSPSIDYTIKTSRVYINRSGRSSDLTVTFPIMYGGDTALQTAVYNKISVDGASKINFYCDLDGNSYANMTLYDIKPGQYDVVENILALKSKSYSLNIDGSKLTNDYTGIYRQYLEPQQYIESDAKEIMDQAEKLKSKSNGILDLVQKTHTFVASYMGYDYNYENSKKAKSSGQGALAAMQSHIGICQDFADLDVALLRANGIPARVSGGLALENYGTNIINLPLMGEGWYDAGKVRHDWVEVYLPPYGWVPTDPTWATSTNDYSKVGNIQNSGHILLTLDDSIKWLCGLGGSGSNCDKGFLATTGIAK